MRGTGVDSHLSRLALSRPAATRCGIVGWSVLILGPTLAAAGDDTPELLPPLDALPVASAPRLVNPTRTPIISTPLTVPLSAQPASLLPPSASSDLLPMTPVAPTPPVAPQSHAVLALPGVAARGQVRRPTLLPMPDFTSSVPAQSTPREPVAAEAGEVTLDGPAEMPDRPIILDRDQDPGRAVGSRGGLPVAIPEPVIEDQTRSSSSSGFDSSRSPSSGLRRNDPSLSGRSSGSRTSTLSSTPVPTRRARFFGLFSPPLAVPPVTLNPRSNSNSNSIRDLGTSRDDGDNENVAAQAALKARIEKQARTYLGDRVRTVEVEVDQRNATVRARGVKFLQKRSVRKTIETLPALSGLRTTIEVED